VEEKRKEKDKRGTRDEWESRLKRKNERKKIKIARGNERKKEREGEGKRKCSRSTEVHNRLWGEPLV
jgi:hypothetical protein